MKIKGKCVLITGGAKRGGAELVKNFAANGAKVILHCNNSIAEAESLLKTLPGCGHRIIRADFAKMDEVDFLINEAGVFDILINNAGVSHFGLISQITSEEWDRLFNINVKVTHHIGKKNQEKNKIL